MSPTVILLSVIAVSAAVLLLASKSAGRKPSLKHKVGLMAVENAIASFSGVLAEARTDARSKALLNLVYTTEMAYSLCQRKLPKNDQTRIEYAKSLVAVLAESTPFSDEWTAAKEALNHI